MDELIDKCILNARISTKNEDVRNNFEDMIDACIYDLKRVGVTEYKKEGDKIIDPLIIMCIKLYTKANFNTASRDSERLMLSYEKLRDSLSLSGEYGCDR